MRNAIPGLVVLLIAIAVLNADGQQTSATSDLASYSAGPWGIKLADRDPSVRAADDLYRSQNGAWLARTRLGPTQPAAAYWRDLRILSTLRLAALVDEAAARRSSPTSAEGKAGAFYRSFMDERGVEARGIDPLKSQLDTIRAAKSKARLAELMGRMEGPGTLRNLTVRIPAGHALFSLNIAQDPRAPSHFTLFVGQAGLQLPGPEFYSDPKLADFKTSFQDYIVRMLTLIGWPHATERAEEIVAFESRVAAVSWSHEQTGDVVKTYNPMTIAELSRFAPGFDWRSFFKGAEIPHIERAVVNARSAFPLIAKVFAETPLEVLQARQALALADEAAPFLNRAMVEANYDFRVGKLNGISQPVPARAFRAEQAVEASLVDLMSALYVARYSSPETKARVSEMAEALRVAFDRRLARNEWMSPGTKQRAREKLARMVIHIGYPDHFQTYEGLSINDHDLYGNVNRANAWNWRYAVSRLERPVDRTEWVLAPGYPQYAYIAARNTVEISAATLQPPFFDLHADAAVNYGAIGAVIGQQIVNGFDNQGGRFDAEGRLADWWTPEDRKRLAAETSKLTSQYSTAEPLPGFHVKGELIADEALDDLGGMLIALDAYHASLRGAPAPVLDGFTGDQRVFLGRAQMWQAKFSEGFLRNQIATGTNAPTFLRVNGPARNMDAFYEAFSVAPEDQMYIPPEKRARIW